MNRSLVISSLAALMLVGCAPKAGPAPRIAHRGDIVAQGGGQLSYRAQAPGLISVYDVTSDAVISSTAAGEGTVVTVNPSVGNITAVDANRAGTQILHTGVSKSHKYELWFIPQSTSTTRWAS